jgi:Fic family protein
VGRYERGIWAPEIAGIDIPRRDRIGGPYQAYIPDKLVGRPFVIAGDVAADVADASIAIARLDTTAAALTNTEALARLLLRAESVGSSYIEGLEVSPARLLRADFLRAETGRTDDGTSAEVLANVDSVTYAIEHAHEDLTVDRICEIHRRLLAPTRQHEHAGIIRQKQNWIGGSEYNPLGAAFIPPPPQYVEELLGDLCTFCNSDSESAVVQAAMAHAQFEMIHPFADGNGRTGRALIQIILRRRGLALRTLPPISLVIATRAKDYVQRLNGLAIDGPPNSPEGQDAQDRWLGFFAACSVRAVADAEMFEKRIAAIQEDWETRLTASRSHSAARALIKLLPERPIITIQGAAKLLKRSIPAATQAVATLVEAKILTEPGKARNRVFEAREIFAAFTSLERSLASPTADTYITPPLRRVPRRQKPEKRVTA